MSEPLPTPWVDLRQVTVRYGRVQALDQVTLRIAPGERVALVGANGSGKSTLLRVLHGLADTHGGGLQCDASWHHNIVRIEGGHELAAGQIQPPIQRSTHPLIRLANEFHSMHRRITSPATQRLLDTPVSYTHLTLPTTPYV